jgi:transposase
MTVPGIGKILALTIMFETGPIKRFAKVGNYASYCRCVGSERISNGKLKGKGNRKNGNKHLSRAYVEAAHYAIRYYEYVKRYHQRKMAKTNDVVARKAIAHKLARACYYIIRDQKAFDPGKLFV